MFIEWKYAHLLKLVNLKTILNDTFAAICLAGFHVFVHFLGFYFAHLNICVKECFIYRRQEILTFYAYYRH